MNIVDLLKKLVGEAVVVNWYSGGIAGAVNPDHYSTQGLIVTVDDTLLIIQLSEATAETRPEGYRDYRYVTINMEDCVVYAVDTLKDPSRLLRRGNNRGA